MGNKRNVLCLLLMVILIFHSRVFAWEGTYNTFNDVQEDHWAYKAIHDMRGLDITDGIGNNLFGMGNTIKRSEFVAFLVKLMEWELISPAEGSFIDNRDKDKWYYTYIETALKQGVIYNDYDSFRVDDPITREEMAVMIVRTLGYDTLAQQLVYLGSPFDDVSENTGYITIARDFGIINGVGNNQFKPYNTAKREEAAAMMMRMYDKLNGPINEFHGFYAIRSAHQMDMIKSLTSVAFGWSRLEYDNQSNQVILNTTRSNNNEFAIPTGFSQPITMAQENGVSTQLMVFAKNDTVLNIQSEGNIPLVDYIISNEEVRSQVIASIVAQINLTEVNDISLAFDGVVIDFENMKGARLKENYNIFLKELKAELDKHNKLLYVAVHPARKPGQEYFDGYDFLTIGEIADKVILMAHDYYAKQLTDMDMEKGYTTTPLTPIDEIYYALKAITDKDTGVQDINKIMLQFSFDVVQWKLQDGRVINRSPYHPTYEALQQRLMMEDSIINYSQRIQNPYLTFYDSMDESQNIVWYEDSRSIQAKISLAKMFGIKGLSIWRIGNIPDYEESLEKTIYLDVWQQILQ